MTTPPVEAQAVMKAATNKKGGQLSPEPPPLFLLCIYLAFRLSPSLVPPRCASSMHASIELFGPCRQRLQSSGGLEANPVRWLFVVRLD